MNKLEQCQLSIQEIIQHIKEKKQQLLQKNNQENNQSLDDDFLISIDANQTIFDQKLNQINCLQELIQFLHQEILSIQKELCEKNDNKQILQLQQELQGLKQHETNIDQKFLLLNEKNSLIKLLEFFQKKQKKLEEVKRIIFFHKENAANKQDVELLNQIKIEQQQLQSNLQHLTECFETNQNKIKMLKNDNKNMIYELQNIKNKNNIQNNTMKKNQKVNQQNFKESKNSIEFDLF